MSDQKTYTIEQIREYLEGWQIETLSNKITAVIRTETYNHSLHNAIKMLDDPEDGIEAMNHKVNRK